MEPVPSCAPDVPALQIELRDKHGLCHTTLLTHLSDLWADDVSRMIGCPFGFQNSLDRRKSMKCHGSEFRTVQTMGLVIDENVSGLRFEESQLSRSLRMWIAH